METKFLFSSTKVLKKMEFKYFFCCLFGYAFRQGLILYRNQLTHLRCRLVNWLLHAVMKDIFRQNVINYSRFKTSFSLQSQISI